MRQSPKFKHFLSSAYSASRRTALAFLVLVVVLVAARIALPSVLKSWINGKLDSIPGYYGEIADIDVSLWRGAYQIQGVKLVKVHGSAKEPLFAADEVDISIDWKALFDRRIVSRIRLHRPTLEFIVRSSKEASQTSVDESWQDKLSSLVPFEINRFYIHIGKIVYKDTTRDPKIDFSATQVELSAENISNATRAKDRLPSPLKITAKVLKSGDMNLAGRLNFLAAPAQFDVNASLKNLELKEINDFAKAYGKFDFEKGTIQFTTEIAATEHQIKGYVKSLAKDVDVVDWSKEKKEGDSTGHLLWEGLVGGIMSIFKNHERDQFAARIPISGARSEIKTDSWAAVGSILRNTFVQALSPKFEDSVAFRDAAQGKDAEGASQKK